MNFRRETSGVRLSVIKLNLGISEEIWREVFGEESSRGKIRRVARSAMYSNYSSSESKDWSPQGPAQIERLADVASISNDDGEVEKPVTGREAMLDWKQSILHRCIGGVTAVCVGYKVPPFWIMGIQRVRVGVAIYVYSADHLTWIQPMILQHFWLWDNKSLHPVSRFLLTGN